jgi:protein disulfide isomerase family A protein 5
VQFIFNLKQKPDYAEAATELKPNSILAAMDVDKSENYKIRTIYNITGFPTILYFKNGNLEFP